MHEQAKRVDELTLDDVHRYPVWEYVSDDNQSDESFVRPVGSLPVSDLRGKIVALKASLANGMKQDILIGNFDTSRPDMNPHFVTLSLFVKGKWFHLARYHDYDAGSSGPQALCSALGLTASDVFPISYDLTECVRGERSVLVGTFAASPESKLSRVELIALSVE